MHAIRSLGLALLAAALRASAGPLTKRSAAYYNPADKGGSMLTQVINSTLGEPLNVIISGLSSPDVLTLDGAINYARAIGFSTECLGLHLGNPQAADLGDGNGYVNQTILLREDYGDASVGTCLESAIGGNHFRIYVQNGTEAGSGALFLATSKEYMSTTGHHIVADGYDIGRDELVSWAVGTTSYEDVTYSTTAENITGLLPVGTAGVNHNISIDGIVALLTVTIQ
ncbi:hypothetical protein FOMPIDRAFT_1016805 [Fomitopsis schrenkii]|uniref:Uncharacterized protein n=1 Tax=Fomitopsis schrenkii TaxID=2126942 RepID=S8E432_FOMSC|nr:hypothetical protein FOMPIDRAFT_1016805 [Fomitopsis schrenkii]